MTEELREPSEREKGIEKLLDEMQSGGWTFKDRVLDIWDSFLRPYKDARYWVRSRFHPKYRYHVIKTGLKPGYYDEDILILYACMTLLERYIDWHDGEQKFEEFTKELQERPDVWGATKDDMDPQVVRQTEALAIYRWWKYDRLADEKRLEEFWDLVPHDRGEARKHGYDDIHALEAKIYDDEQRMLHRLINIRQSLWE